MFIFVASVTGCVRAAQEDSVLAAALTLLVRLPVDSLCENQGVPCDGRIIMPSVRQSSQAWPTPNDSTAQTVTRFSDGDLRTLPGKLWQIGHDGADLEEGSDAVRVWIVYLRAGAASGSEVRFGVTIALPRSAYPVVGTAIVRRDADWYLASLQLQES
jgi:hypothetical protein